MNIRWFIAVISVFSLGWIFNTLLTSMVYYDIEKPFSISFLPFNSPEVASPGDHLKDEDIHVYDSKVVIDAPGATWAEFTDTNSMDPFMDETANSIEIAPRSPDDISVGDIISYRSALVGGLVVHRVVEKGEDEDGVFYIVKGDNNSIVDPEKVRFRQVNGVLIAILY